MALNLTERYCLWCSTRLTFGATFVSNFINDLPNASEFLTLLFADDTTFQISGMNTDHLFQMANSELEKSSVWFRSKCKLASANFGMNSSKNFLPLKIRKTLYFSLFESHLNFGNLLWGCANNKLINQIENLRKKCIRNVALKNFRAHTEPIFKNLGILKFTDKLSYCRSVFMHQYRHNKLPPSFTGIFSETTMSNRFQSRHNDYNYLNEPGIKRSLEKLPLKANYFHLELT